MTLRIPTGLIVACALLTAVGAGAPTRAAPARHAPTLAETVSFPYQSELASAERADRVAWVQMVRGVRNVWMAEGPDFKARQLTRYDRDDGQEITQLTFSPDGARLLFVRGGDHDANWDAAGGLQPDPDGSTEEPKVAIFSVDLKDGRVARVVDGDAPTISARGQLAYLVGHQVWTAPLDASADPAQKPHRLFFDRGKDGELTWSPDGSTLAFVSERGDHAFIGLYAGKDRPLRYVDPSTGQDGSPRWSLDGARIAFVRQRGEGGAPRPILKEQPEPFAIRVAELASGHAHEVWRSPDTAQGSIPGVAGGVNLNWATGDRLTFTAELDGWNHLYAVAAAGGQPVQLTKGAFMVEHVVPSRDRRFVIYDANTGRTVGDGERRHLFRVPADRAEPVELTGGETLEWAPVIAGEHSVAAITAGYATPPSLTVVYFDRTRRDIGPATPYDATGFVKPRPVTWTAPDGQTVHGVLFSRADAKGRKPAVVFVHGGPPRQMLLGWHYMDYYSNAYAVNQWLAQHGYVVLSVNYRLGIGYGRAWQHPDAAGPRGSSEYQDVLAGAKYLQTLPGVDGARIGIWGGSYGGLLTALALARNSDVFKAGVDLHGVHDWSGYIAKATRERLGGAEPGDMAEALQTAWKASPVADVATWRSPVLLIQGDDDRNVEFHQTVDLARRLEAVHAPYEEMVLPNEIHGFLRNASWVAVDGATVDFLDRKLGAPGR